MALSVALLGAACRDAPEPQSDALPIHVQVGEHELSFLVPDGWDRFDHGREQRLRRSRSQLLIEDYGPVTREGYRREVRNARWLFREQQIDDARAILKRLELQSFFGERRWSEVAESWDRVLGRGRFRKSEPYELDAACDRLERGLVRVETPELVSIVRRITPRIDRATHREISDPQTRTVDGRPAVLLQTWDKMTHGQRLSHLFVLNGGNMLVVRMESGAFTEMEAPFHEIVDSLEIHPRATASLESTVAQ